MSNARATIRRITIGRISQGKVVSERGLFGSLTSLLIALTAFLPGCSSVMKGVYLSPFYRRIELPDGTERTTFLGPLGYAESQPDGSSKVGLRPFYHRSMLDEETIDEVRSLWPLFSYNTRGGTESRFFLLPFFYHIERPGNEGPETDWALLPLFFGGREGSGESYFAFFPLFGTLRGFLTQDQIDFVLFPLYTALRRNEFKSKNFLFPLIHVGKGGGRKSLRLFPFYSSDEKDGRYARYSAAWPFFHWQQNYLHTEDPASMFLFFPFYGKETSINAQKSILLWPFFSWAEDDKRNYYEKNLPWPFYKSVESPNLKRTKLWPFFGNYEADEIKSKFYLWPFFYDRHETTDKYTKDSSYVVPFYTSYERTDLETGVIENYRQVWPFYRRRADDTEGSEVSLLSPIPFRKFGPLEEDYGFLWKLYEKEEDPQNGQRRRRLFLGIYDSEHGEDYDSRTIPFLYDHYRARNKSITSYLLGLVRYEEIDRESRLSLFWLPPLFRWSRTDEEGAEK